VGDFEPGMDSHTQAALLSTAIKDLSPDMVFAGVQAADDLDGQIGPLLAANLGMPYIGVVAGVEADGQKVKILKEYSGGIIAEFEAAPPVVVGVQAAASPPRYAPVSKIRQMAQTAEITELELDAGGAGGGLKIKKMSKPVSSGHAEMITGSAKEVAGKIIELVKERGLL
ncbi:MAG: electron transfer flavoprotein subunit beta, partial [Anaerolineae bacterium]|nr:electron transfer flavoprotein subunit beta [Anaerolineae bacterium]